MAATTVAIVARPLAPNIRGVPKVHRDHLHWNLCKGFAFETAMEADGYYFAGRELDERAMSHEAADTRAAAAHAELAERYEALAAVFGAKRLADLPVDYL